MARTFYLSATASDLTGGADFNQLLATATGTPGTVSTTVGPGATDVNLAWTGVGIPGTGGATGNYTIKVNITVANASIQGAIQIHRVNSAGVVQTSSAISGEQAWGTTGVKTYTFNAQALGTWASGDRLRVDYRARSTAGHGTSSVTLGTDTTSESVDTPFADPNVVVTPPTASLTTTRFAPTVTVTDNKTVTPPVKALSLSTFAPTVSTPVLVTPPTKALTISTFAPTVTVGGGDVTVTVPLASLSLSFFAPSVQTPVATTVPLATLAITTFAPTVTASSGSSGPPLGTMCKKGVGV